MRFAFAFDLFDHLFDHLFDTFDLRLKNKSQSIGFTMPRKLPESTRSAVVQKWLEGLSRNKISAPCGVSQAAVSGIIDDWKKSVGVSLAEQYRDLALTLERNGISVVQCAQGFRIFKLMSNLGVKEDEVEAFLGETYNRCLGIGLHPREIASHLAALVSFVDCRSLGIGKDIKDDQCNIPSISRIAEYLEDSKEEIGKQEQRIEHLKKEEESAEAKKSSVMRDTERILKEHNMTVEKLNWYSQLKTELLKSGHSGNDFAHLIKAIDWLTDKGYDFLAIVDQFSKHEALESSPVTGKDGH